MPYDESVTPTKSWLHAYDLLSSGEYDYTTEYDTASNLFSHETLILSIDPPTNNIIEQTFEDNFSSPTDWNPISGTWKYTENGIEAGKNGEYQDAILLSPILAQKFTD